MKIIVGQGNPGSKYSTTRHNVGWLMLDKYASIHGVEFANKSKFQALIAELNLSGEKVLLVKPTTFYNDTGLAVRLLIDFYNLQLDDVLVLHDDIALPYGILRVRDSGSDAGNNGIKSITRHLGTDRYWRFRIGIRPSHDISDLSQYVLGSLNKDDLTTIDKLTPSIISQINTFITGQSTAVSISSKATTEA